MESENGNQIESNWIQCQSYFYIVQLCFLSFIATIHFFLCIKNGFFFLDSFSFMSSVPIDSDSEDGSTVSFKVILLGDGSVGKSSLCARFTEDSFSKSYKQTIGCDFFVKHVHLPGLVWLG